MFFIDSPFHSNLDIWSISPFHSNFNILIDLTFCTQISTFWSIPIFALKFQHFDWLLPFHPSFNILIDLIIITQISAFWLIPNSVFKFQCFHWFPLSLKFGHFDQSLLFTQISTFWSTWHFTNFNILINSQHFPQISIFWSIPYFSIKLQHIDRFPLLQ